MARSNYNVVLHRPVNSPVEIVEVFSYTPFQRENFRITKERYKKQMSTSTDVLDARTLLSRTMTNYYNALYDLKLSKASLVKSMSVESIQ